MTELNIPVAVIPADIDDDYSGALAQMPAGENTLVGYKEQLAQLESHLNDPELPNALLLAEQGMGKTALVEQEIYNRGVSGNNPLVLIRLDIETLGALGLDIMLKRLRNILSTMKKIDKATETAIGHHNYQMALFIDEVHKLYGYGLSGNSSRAMNALKEGTGRGEFPIITATTDYEFRSNLRPDRAFTRRFHKVALSEPTLELTKEIITRRAHYWVDRLHGEIDMPSKSFIDELVMYADAYIRNQVNPAKSLSMLTSCIGYVRSTGKPFDHEAIAFVLGAEGFNIDIHVDLEKAKKLLEDSLIGQPLAIKVVLDILSVSMELPHVRNHKQPLATAWFGGSTGTGKSEMSKLLAQILFGRRDALVVLNGGDYPTLEDAIIAQHFIGDSMVGSKQKIILLDEIEKSHPAVQMSYMRMIDEGIVRDSDDVEQSLNNTMIIATSNLASESYAELKSLMELEYIENPSKLTDEYLKQWAKQEPQIRSNMLDGDTDKNNGVRPEFLERFRLVVPFVPFPRLVLGQIAHMMLKSEQDKLLQDGVRLQLPKTKDRQYWIDHLGAGLETQYGGLNKIDVFIAQDVMTGESAKAGARSIARFIKTSLEPKVATLKSQLIRQNIDYTRGVFQLNTNGQTSVDTDSKNYADIAVTFRPDL